MKSQRNKLNLVAIGASAGGPSALANVFSKLPSGLTAAFVVSQHMPRGFTKQLSARLTTMSNVKVREAQSDDILQAGTALVTPGGHNMEVAEDGRIILEEAKQTPSPSIDIMMKSAASSYGPRCVGVLMTGMLHDGVLGMKAIKEAGGVTIAQDESSSLVFGMNKSAIQAGAVDTVVHVSDIALTIVDSLLGVSREQAKIRFARSTGLSSSFW